MSTQTPHADLSFCWDGLSLSFSVVTWRGRLIFQAPGSLGSGERRSDVGINCAWTIMTMTDVVRHMVRLGVFRRAEEIARHILKLVVEWIFRRLGVRHSSARRAQRKVTRLCLRGSVLLGRLGGDGLRRIPCTKGCRKIAKDDTPTVRRKCVGGRPIWSGKVKRSVDRTGLGCAFPILLV